MSTRPDLAGVLAEHWFTVRNVKPGSRWVGCSCGWMQPEDNHNAARHGAHVSDFLNAEVERWADELADEWDACDEHGNPLREGSLSEAADELRSALAALTTPTATEPEEGKR